MNFTNLSTDCTSHELYVSILRTGWSRESWREHQKTMLRLTSWKKMSVLSRNSFELSGHMDLVADLETSGMDEL